MSSVDNALQALLLLQSRAVVRVSDVSEELGVARSTAHRILSALVYRGFATQDATTRAYAAGPVLSEIGYASLGRMAISARARSAMESLAITLGETVYLMALERSWIRYIDGAEGSHVVRVGLRIGHLLPAHCSSGGKAILATLDAEQLVRLYPDEKLQTLTPESIATRTALRAELKDIARRGYATNFGESEADVWAVGIALSPRVGTTAAIAVSAPALRPPEDYLEPYVAAVLQAARNIDGTAD